MPSTITGEQNLISTVFASNGTLTIPAGYALQSVFYRNTTANAVTGGIKIGTTEGGTDVLLALAVGANAVGHISDSSLLKRYFSATLDQTLYVQTVTLWNSASVNLIPVLVKVE